MEAWTGVEPVYSGFADRRLTTWLPGHFLFDIFEEQERGSIINLADFLQKIKPAPTLRRGGVRSANDFNFEIADAKFFGCRN